MPWLPQWWAVVLTRGLLARGHRVGVVVDGTECPDAFAGAELHTARPLRMHLGAHPGRFIALARDIHRRHPGSVLLSLSPMLPGQVWLPVEPAPAHTLRRLIRELKPVSLVLELLHHPWMPFEALAAARAGSGGLAFDDPRGVPVVSTLTDEEVLAAHAAGPAAARALGLEEGVPHAVLPVVDLLPRRLAPLLAALAACPVRVLAPTSRPNTLAGLARRAGLAGLTPLTLTASLPAITAACGLAIAGPGGPGSGRWVADAMRLGVPVLADPSAPGAGVVEELGGGEVVRGGASGGGWAGALGRAADPAWRAAVSRRLGMAAERLAPSVLLDRVELLASRVSAAMVGPRDHRTHAEA